MTEPVPPFSLDHGYSRKGEEYGVKIEEVNTITDSNGKYHTLSSF